MKLIITALFSILSSSAFAGYMATCSCDYHGYTNFVNAYNDYSCGTARSLAASDCVASGGSCTSISCSGSPSVLDSSDSGYCVQTCYYYYGGSPCGTVPVARCTDALMACLNDCRRQ